MKRRNDARAWLVLISLAPFIFGFNFLSAIKNEEGNNPVVSVEQKIQVSVRYSPASLRAR